MLGKFNFMKLFYSVMFLLFFISTLYAEKPAVFIENKNTHYQVEINYLDGVSRKEIGKLYGHAILKAVPNYEYLVDSYLKEKIPSQAAYLVLLIRAKAMKQNLDPLYVEEIDGISSAFSYGAENKLGDGMVSRDEFLLLSLLPDVGRATQCSVISVWGSRSSTGGSLIARSLDWFSGSSRQLNRIQSLTAYHTPGKNTVMSIGYLGFSGILTGINSKRLFAAILDSPSGKKNGFFYHGYRSYSLDLRQALEEESDPMNVGQRLSSQPYAFNHLVFLGDRQSGYVLENALEKKRELRKDTSELNLGITWGYNDSVAAVNSFLIKGNPKNHDAIPINPPRWDIFKKFMRRKPVVSLAHLKDLFSTTRLGRPDSQGKGELYHFRTQQIVLFDPGSLALEIFFSPVKGQPKKPVFEKIMIRLLD